MLQFDIRTNASDVTLQMQQLQKKHLPSAMMDAANATGRYIHAALRSEMSEVFDRPTSWTLGGLRFKLATRARPEVNIWLEDFGGKGTASGKYLTPQITGGARKHKRFERALILAGIMAPSMFAVPGRQAPVDAHGNVPGSFITRMLSDLRAFGEQGYRANRRAGRRKGRKATNAFFSPPKGSTLKPGVYWRLPNRMIVPVFLFVRQPHYAKRYDFYGVGRRAYERVALRFLNEALANRVRLDNH